MLSKHEQIIFYFTNESFAKANWSGDISVDESWVMDDRSGFKVQLPNVGGDFYCDNNDLTTLVGAPKSVGGDFYCYNNNLTTLVGAPKSVGGDFYCDDNPRLKNPSRPDGLVGKFFK